MRLFDFHLHPGYDFHAEALSDTQFIQGLREFGTVRCAGSVICKGDSNREIAEYAEILPRLNDDALALHAAHSDFYLPGIHVHPDHAELSCREIERCAARGARLVGELVPYLMGWRDYADKRLFEILDVAQSLSMVLCFHPSKDVAAMEALLANFPKMPIVVAHLDGYGLYDFAIEMMQKYENVHFDISAHGASRAGMLEDAVARVGSERILYGTDYPGYSPKDFVDALLAAKLTDTARENIAYNNAARLLLK